MHPAYCPYFYFMNRYGNTDFMLLQIRICGCNTVLCARSLSFQTRSNGNISRKLIGIFRKNEHYVTVSVPPKTVFAP